MQPAAILEESDEALVSRVRSGDSRAFEQLVRRHNPRVFRVVRGILGADDDSEDVMQQAYIAAYVHLDQFAGAARFSTWLTRIAIHAALARRRQTQRMIPRAPDALAAQSSERRDDPESIASRGETLRAVEAVIDSLPPGYRTVLVLRELEGMSTAEVAAALEATEEAIKVRLHRARALLKKGVESRLGEAYPFHLVRCNRIVAAVFRALGGPLGAVAVS